MSFVPGLNEVAANPEDIAEPVAAPEPIRSIDELLLDCQSNRQTFPSVAVSCAAPGSTVPRVNPAGFVQLLVKETVLGISAVTVTVAPAARNSSGPLTSKANATPALTAAHTIARA